MYQCNNNKSHTELVEVSQMVNCYIDTLLNFKK